MIEGNQAGDNKPGPVAGVIQMATKDKSAEKREHGGKRAGAGRKPGETPPKPRGSYRLSIEVKAYLDSLGRNAAETVDKAIRKTAGFKAFQQ